MVLVIPIVIDLAVFFTVLYYLYRDTIDIHNHQIRSQEADRIDINDLGHVFSLTLVALVLNVLPIASVRVFRFLIRRGMRDASPDVESASYSDRATYVVEEHRP